MPTNATDELNRIMEEGLRGYVLNLESLFDEITEISNREDITFEEQILAKLLLVETIFNLAYFGIERFTLEESYKLAHEVYEEYDKIENVYLKYLSLITLSYMSFSLNYWKEAIDWYDKSKPIWDKLEPSNDLLFLKDKVHNYLIGALSPFFKVYSGDQKSLHDKTESLRLLKEGDKFAEKHGFLFARIMFLHNYGVFQYYEGDLKGNLETRLKMRELTKTIDNKITPLFVLDGLASAYLALHDYKKYYDLHKERLAMIEELGLRFMLVGSYSALGYYYSVTGSYEEALEYYNKCLDINKEFNREAGIADSQLNIGRVYSLIGNLKKSIEYMLKAAKYFESKTTQSLPYVLSEIASALQLAGALDNALEYLGKSMEIYEGIQNQNGICSVLSEQGVIYWQKGIQDEAIALIEKSLDIALKIGDGLKISSNASYLVQFYLEQNAVDKAQENLEIIEQTSKKSKLQQVKFDLKFSSALILRHSTDDRERIKAELLLEQLLEEDTTYSLEVKVLLQLCSVLLENLRETNNKKILEKIKSHVKTLQDLSENNNSHILLVETLRLKAQLELIEFNFKNARSFLLKAQTIAQENGFDKLVLDILGQQENLTKQSIELNKLDKNKSTLASRMSVVNLEETVVNIKKTSISKTVSREEVTKKLLSIQI